MLRHVGIRPALVTAVLTSALFLVGSLGASAQAAGGSPAIPAADSTPGVLAAPSNVQLDRRNWTISWADNSQDETGFQIVYTAAPTLRTYSAPANSESFSLPPDAPRPPGGRFHVEVRATSPGGQSAAGEYTIIVESQDVDSTLVPAQTVVPISPRLPATGSGPHGDESTHWASLLGAAALVVLAMLGMALGASQRAPRRR